MAISHILTFVTSVLYIQACFASAYYGRYNFYQINESSEEPNPDRIIAVLTEPILENIPKSPLFYGWFYDSQISDSLKLISEKYLANSYDFVPEFTGFLDKVMYFNNVTDPFAYYEKPVDPDTGRMDDYYHTTAKFCGGIDCSSYLDRVSDDLGKPFKMHLVGLFFTKTTYGIRIKLTPEEQNIFDVDERKNTLQAVGASETHETVPVELNPNSLQDLELEYEGYFQTGRVVPNNPLYPGIHFEPQFPDFHPTESRAHITIGCAPGVEAVQTGLDLVEIINLEISAHIFHQDFSIGGGDLPVATLRQFGGDGEEDELAFVIYPTEKMVADATFYVYT